MLKLLEEKMQLTKKAGLTLIDLGIGNTSDIVDGTIRTMSKKKTIEITPNNILQLTSKGQVAARKVKRNYSKREGQG